MSRWRPSRVTSDHSQTNREIINRLWEVLDDPYLNQALGNLHNRRSNAGGRFWLSRFYPTLMASTIMPKYARQSACIRPQFESEGLSAGAARRRSHQSN